MLHIVKETLKELFQILILWEVITVTIRFVLFRRIRGKHILIKAIYKGFKNLLRLAIKEVSKAKEQPKKATPSNVIQFRKRA